MKIHVLLIFIALLFCGKAAYAQGITYEKNFGGIYNGARQYDIKEMKTNGYLVAGSLYDSGAGKYDAYCVRLDSNGNMLWSKTYGTSLSDVSTICWGTSDGGFIMAFNARTSIYLDYQDTLKFISIAKCDSNGNVQWSKCLKCPDEISHPTGITPTNLYQSKQGDYYLLCDWFSHGYQPQFTFLKLDASGELKWIKSINGGLRYTYESKQILEVYTGDIVVVESADGDGFYVNGNYIHLFSFSPKTGVVKQSKVIDQYQKNGYHGYIDAFYLTATNDKLNITGRYSKQGYYDKVCWFSFTLDKKKVRGQYISLNYYSSFQYLINKNFIDRPAGSFDHNVVFTKDGGYLYAYSGIRVKKYDSLGRICPNYASVVIDTTIHEASFTIKDIPYTLVNSSFTLTDTSLTVTNVTAQQTACEGTAPLIADKIENTSSVVSNKMRETKLQLYPNPANDFVNISFEVNKAAIIQFTIINTEGKTVLTKQLFTPFGKQQTTINIQSLPAGAYYIKIIGLNKPTAIQFLKTK